MGERKAILEQEIEQLRCLQGLMKAERECLARMNGEGLLRLVREKDGLVRRLARLQEERRTLPGTSGPGAGDAAQALRELFVVRNALVSELREQSRVHERILEEQSERVGHMLGFFRSVFSRNATYDRNGRMRAP
jgi:flagellar biosynthesis/type III secretory pathway chaperone